MNTQSLSSSSSRALIPSNAMAQTPAGQRPSATLANLSLPPPTRSPDRTVFSSTRNIQTQPPNTQQHDITANTSSVVTPDAQSGRKIKLLEKKLSDMKLAKEHAESQSTTARAYIATLESLLTQKDESLRLQRVQISALETEANRQRNYQPPNLVPPSYPQCRANANTPAPMSNSGQSIPHPVPQMEIQLQLHQQQLSVLNLQTQKDILSSQRDAALFQLQLNREALAFSRLIQPNHQFMAPPSPVYMPQPPPQLLRQHQPIPRNNGSHNNKNRKKKTNAHSTSDPDRGIHTRQAGPLHSWQQQVQNLDMGAPPAIYENTIDSNLATDQSGSVKCPQSPQQDVPAWHRELQGLTVDMCTAPSTLCSKVVTPKLQKVPGPEYSGSRTYTCSPPRGVIGISGASPEHRDPVPEAVNHFLGHTGLPRTSLLH